MISKTATESFSKVTLPSIFKVPVPVSQPGDIPPPELTNTFGTVIVPKPLRRAPSFSVRSPPVKVKPDVGSKTSINPRVVTGTPITVSTPEENWLKYESAASTIFPVPNISGTLSELFISN